ncbi:hypothetical protein [Mesorhizobium sp. M4B.F.Ca.ET.143.01.1.1]|uniref:hypothetical protein n=1 Tax=Mesorhizobium sp. M4B.F.Ca.ET.143.01.1.1 TaxID=2563947 RepID=UPI001AED392F|nr:hypothetical protein [Mesorhizobium sp. M4B.F.Ca.ET.143.01.1.1]
MPIFRPGWAGGIGGRDTGPGLGGSSRQRGSALHLEMLIDLDWRGTSARETMLCFRAPG